MDINYTISEAKDFVLNGQRKSYGDANCVISYNDMLVKWGFDFYNMLFWHYRDSKRLQMVFDKQFPMGDISSEQLDRISYFKKEQALVKYSNFPVDIMYVEEKPMGIILPKQDKNYHSLYWLEDVNNKELLILLKNILLLTKELMDHHIYPVMLNPKNVIYNGKTPFLVNLDESYVGRDNVGYEKQVYDRLIMVLEHVIQRGQDLRILKDYRDLDKLNNYSYGDMVGLIKKLDKRK